jgi:hypothetical protein
LPGFKIVFDLKLRLLEEVNLLRWMPLLMDSHEPSFSPVKISEKPFEVQDFSLEIHEKWNERSQVFTRLEKLQLGRSVNFIPQL